MFNEIENSLAVLQKGGTILYPTDTVWGIGCDATQVDALKRVCKIKQRSDEKSFILLVDGFSMLERYVKHIPDVAYDLIDLSDSPLTLVFDTPQHLPKEVLAQDGSVAIRIVKHSFCQKLIEKLKKPLVSTSANISGKTTPLLFEDIDPIFLQQIDYVVNYERTTRNSSKPSSIIKINADASFKILRK